MSPCRTAGVYVTTPLAGTVLAGLLVLSSAAPGRAQTAPTQTAPTQTGAVPTGPRDPVSVLLEQANFWRGQAQLDRSIESLNRALLIDPRNPDVLALLAQVQSDRGNRQTAQATLAKLRQVAPDDPRIPRIEQALKVGPVPDASIEEARRSARAGRFKEAVDRYDQAFHNGPPPDQYAVEYYQTLVGTEDGWERARDGLARAVRQDPTDLRAQVAYAQVLSYREGVRLDGIDRLARLAQDPAVSAEATQAWRQALVWLPNDPSSVDALTAYLKAHPNDGDIANKIDLAKNPQIAEPGGQGRISGFAALNKGRLAEAAAAFQKAIEVNDADADAIGGLGVVRLRQGNASEAKTLLTRAIALDPEHKDRWQEALAGANAAIAGAARGGGGPNPAQAMIDRGDYAAAERELDRQIAQGRAAGADVTGLQVMLVGVLSREGRDDEASALLDRLEATAPSRAVAQARAQVLRGRAQAATDPAVQLALFRAAVAADPSNPWVRLDLARALVKQNRLTEARATMAEAVNGPASTDALRAGIIFANETNDPGAADALIERLPAGIRDTELRALQARARLQSQIASAAALGPVIGRQRLMAMAAAPDPDGSRGAAIAQEFVRMNDEPAAREAILVAQAANLQPTAGARLAYASALLNADAPADAQAMLAQINPDRLTGQQRADMQQLRAGMAVRTSDQLNQQGRQADAYDRLAPVLAQNPESPDLNMALARLYEGAKNPREALAINEALLRRDPSNQDVRRATIAAALDAGDRARADALVQEGLQLTPNDPKAWLAAADYARARGDNGRALRYLERARALRLQQMGYADDGGQLATPASPGAQSSLTPGGLPAGGIRVGDLNVPPGLVGAPDPDAAGPRMVMQASEDLTLPPPMQVAQSAPGGVDMATVPSEPVLDTGPFGRPATNLAPSTYPPPPIAASQFAPGQIPPSASQTAPFGTSSYAPSSFVPVAGNPFRNGSSSGFALNGVGDPLTAEIDRNIAALRIETAPSMQGGFDMRFRSGDPGFDKLADLESPLEASFSPGGAGRLRLTVTPTFLNSGTPDPSNTNLQRFGTSALGLVAPVPGSGVFTPSYVGAVPGDQTATGVGLNAAYTLRSFTADVGSTPLGFRLTNVVGGVEWAPAITDNLHVRFTGERRAVTDSLLSYAGTQDARTGETWGGVIRNRGHINLEFGTDAADFYLGGGGALVTGTNVQQNNEVEFGAGAGFPVYKSGDQSLRAGLDLVYFSYTNNLSNFTLGQGGYFSPQNYFAALIPLTWRDKVSENLSYEIGGALGYQTYHENSSPIFPLDPALQAQLNQIQANPATHIAGVNTSYPANSASGVTGNAHGLIDYRLAPNLHIGAKFAYQHAGNFYEGAASVYARYIFDGSDH